MWNYEKRLEYPIRIKQNNPQLAKVIITQYGGPNGELGASMRYLSQRFAMPYKEVCGVLTDIGVSDVKRHNKTIKKIHFLEKIGELFIMKNKRNGG